MAETNNKDGRWVTLDNGVHLFIKKGQTLDDAIEKLENSPEKPKIRTEKNDAEIRRINKPIDKQNAELAKTYAGDKDLAEKFKNKIKNDETFREEIKKIFGKEEPKKEDPKSKVQKSAKDVASGEKDTNAGAYKGYAIEKDFYGDGEFSVQYAGDDYLFASEAEAKKFIDGIKDSEADEKLSAREYGKKYAKGGNNGARSFTDEDRERLDMANSWQEQIKIAKEINKRNGNTEAFDYLNEYTTKPKGMEKALKREKIKSILNKPHRTWQEVEDVINQTSEDEALKSKAIKHAEEYYKEYISEAKNKKDKQLRQEDFEDIRHVIKNGDTNYFWRMDTIIRDTAVAFIEKALTGKSKDFNI